MNRIFAEICRNTYVNKNTGIFGASQLPKTQFKHKNGDYSSIIIVQLFIVFLHGQFITFEINMRYKPGNNGSIKKATR